MIKKISSLLLFLLFVCTALQGQLLAPPGEPLDNDPSVRVGQLDNGLTYYIKHNAKPEKRAEFYLFTHVGAIEESDQQAGLAHFLEHMAFNGTKNFPDKGILNAMERIGARFGENINAGTGVEQTSYMLNNIPVIREGIIDTALLVIHDWAHLITNDPAEIEKERPVIIEEWRTRSSANIRVYEANLPVLYQGSKYATCNVIGTVEGLSTFPAEQLVNFYQKWYRPDLQAVIVVGDIDVDEVELKIKTLFAPIPKPTTPNPKELFPVPDNKEPLINIVTDPELSTTSISLYFKHQPLPKEINPTGAAYILGMMKSMTSSMFNDRLREISQKPDAPFLGATVGFGALCQTVDVLSTGVVSKEGAGVTAFSALLQELERVDRFGFTQSELERAKTNLIRRLERRAENADDRTNSEFVWEYISHFADNNPYMTPEVELQVAMGYLPFIQLDQINELVKASITDENRVILYSAPLKAGVAIPNERDFLSAINMVKSAPLESYKEEVSSDPLLDPTSLKAGKVSKEEVALFGGTLWTLENGVRVVIKPTDFKKDEVTFTAYRAGGTSTVATEDLPSVETGLTMFMSVSGISNFPVTELNKKLSGKIATVTPYISSYDQGFRGSASPKDFEVMLQLLYLRITAPRFVESEFASIMAQLNAIVPNLPKQPSYLFSKELTDVLYKGNPRRTLISEESVAQINFITMERVYRTLLCAADGMTFVIVGNVDPVEIKPLIEKYIGSLPIRGESPVWKDEGIYLPKGKIEHPFTVPMETPKATVRQTYHGEMPNTPENRVKIAFLKQVLDLIYVETIREEEGGSYGVGVSGSVSNKPIDLFQLVIGFDTNPTRASEMAALAKKGVNDIALQGPTREQVQKTIENMIKRFEENMIQNGFWSSMLQLYYRDQIDDFSQYEKIVKEMTVESVKEFAQKILSTGNFVELIMMPL